MEYRESKCPHCQEMMQVPLGREKIICMFCGKEFSPGVEEEKKEAVYQSQMELLQEGVAGFFQNVEKTVAGFKRNGYEESFRQFCIMHSPCIKAIVRECGGAPDREKAMQEIAALFVESGRAVLAMQKGRIGRENMQLNLNMLMVTYTLPAILESNSADMRTLADEICDAWGRAFKNSSIKATDYASIKSGFRTKLCYITTAVCESLNKSADCYELTLLKQYRDKYLLSIPGGEELVEKYYDIAPTIVKRINRSQEPKAAYHMIWDSYLKPCVQLIEEDRNEECREVYTDMVKQLHRKYMEGGHE